MDRKEIKRVRKLAKEAKKSVLKEGSYMHIHASEEYYNKLSKEVYDLAMLRVRGIIQKYADDIETATEVTTDKLNYLIPRCLGSGDFQLKDCWKLKDEALKLSIIRAANRFNERE